MSQRPLVVVTDFLTEAGPEQQVLSGVADVRLLHANDEAEVIERATDADALLAFHEIQLSERSLTHLARCKGIVRSGVGVDNIDVEAAGRRGIVVCNVPDYGTEEVADHAVMLLLA